MSITGETAIVRVVVPNGVVWTAEHGVEIDKYFQGNETVAIVDDVSFDDSVSPFSTCGEMERRDVACWEDSHPVEFERTRPVARLLIANSGLCTGWRVGQDNHMFTNNHCVATESRLQDTEVWFNYQRTACNGSEFQQVVKVTGDQLLKTDYDLDYTLFSVNGFAEIADFGFFGLEVRPPVQDERIFIAQHGSGNPKELAIESDQNNGGLCQIDVVSANGRATGVDTGYFCDTIGGSSGSPVLAADTGRAIALHHFGGCENQGVRIDKIWPQVASYFGNVPPVGDNEVGGKPIATFVQSCNELDCAFDASGSVDTDGTIDAFVWQFGDGTTGVGERINHYYSEAGSYNVVLEVTDNEGKTDKRIETIEVGKDSNVLEPGVPVSNLSGDKGEELVFYIDMPEDQTRLDVKMSGGTGDADLYVKAGVEPTKDQWDCRPYSAGNAESCSGNYQGRVFIKIIGYSNFNDVTLIAETSNVGSPDWPKTALSAPDNEWLTFEYPVEAGVGALRVKSSGGTGDADLYVRVNQSPTINTYDCRPYSSGNSESCDVTASEGDVVFIGLRAYRAFSDVTLDVERR
ncbi:pre-peptidase C-terminal domain-containing protein [Veronia pacifica]